MPNPIGSIIVDEVRRVDGELYLPALRWQRQVPVSPRSWSSAAWSPALGLFAAVASISSDPIAGAGTTGQVMTSPDGITWTPQASASYQNWISIEWSPALGLFVAVASNGAVGVQVMTSPDGVVWTSQTSAAAVQWQTIAWSPTLNLFCAVSVSGPVAQQVMTSPDGVVWTSQLASDAKLWFNVVWADRLGLFVARAAASTGNCIMTSPDGVNWTTQVFAPGANVAANGIAWSSSLNLLVAPGVGAVPFLSTDGITWTQGPTTQGLAVAFSKVKRIDEIGLFFGTIGGTVIFTSPDGANWSVDLLPQPSPPTATITSIAFSPTRNVAVAVGTMGLVLTRSYNHPPMPAPTNQLTGAGVGLGTLTNAPTAGDPAFWLPIIVNGIQRYIPVW